MASLQDPFQGPITVGKAAAQVVIYLVVAWLGGRIFVVLGLPQEVALPIACAAFVSLSMIRSARRGYPPRDVSLGLADLWLFALVILLAVILRAFRDHQAWPYAVVLGLAVVGFGVLVEVRRKTIDQAEGHVRDSLADPQVDDVR